MNTGGINNQEQEVSMVLIIMTIARMTLDTLRLNTEILLENHKLLSKIYDQQTKIYELLKMFAVNLQNSLNN